MFLHAEKIGVAAGPDTHMRIAGDLGLVRFTLPLSIQPQGVNDASSNSATDVHRSSYGHGPGAAKTLGLA